jgi:two-component system OmpR family sensor kinase/two-component system sensor histidine kinase QseC
VVIPLVLLLPIMIIAAAWIVDRGLLPLRYVAAEVQRRDVRSLDPLGTERLPREIEPLVSELNRLLERLQRAFSAQRAFISDAAHELRSPLTALRLQLQLLDRAPDEAARLEARGRLGAAVERAIHLVEQLLAMARSEPQETAADFETVDLAAAAADGIRDTHDLAVARSIDLGLDATPNVFVRGDREALRVLVRNLVDNAVRYTPPNGSVHVRCRANPTEAVLEVTDTGPGIAPADRERVFDRFYRHATAQENGTGLGLAIVKAIAERHGAGVILDDAPGGGLHVGVHFPRSPS